MRRFAGFELDEQRAELRGPDGAPVRLRPKSFEMLRFLVGNAGRVISKSELMEAVWPSVHVSEDSLFQCIRELRAALGDERRELVKVVFGRGYLFEAVVTGGAEAAQPLPARGGGRRPAGLDRRAAFAALGGLALVVALTFAGLVWFKGPAPRTVAVMPIVATGSPDGAAMAAAVTEALVDGLAGIDNLQVVAQPAAGAAAPGFLIQAELDGKPQAWSLKARILHSATGQVHAVGALAVDRREVDPELQQSRLVAGLGDALARRLNTLLEDVATAPSTAGRAAVEQATAAINQTSHERFAVAEAMLRDALSAAPGDVDLQVALAALQLRGIQMVWYAPEQVGPAEAEATALLKQALAVRPRSIAALEAKCRLLSATNAFAESLVACGQVLSLDPWNGTALYLVGLGQLYLGRFEDALATFELADRYDTPAVSRWTWLLGAGWANLLLGRNEAALPWTERSIAITPASGRSHMMLAVIYHRLGRDEEARAAMARALELRPGSTAENVRLPTGNASRAFVAAGDDITRTFVELGLPEH